MMNIARVGDLVQILCAIDGTLVELYIQRGCEAAGDMAMEFGPAHVVWSDENFDTASIESCLSDPEVGDLTPAERVAVLQSLRELLAVPEEIRCCEPEDYDGEHPANFPPPEGLVMRRKRG